MQILYIVPFIPSSLRVRSFNLIPRLVQRHSIDLICLASSTGEREKLNGVSSLCSSVRCATHSRATSLFQAVKSLPTSVPLRMAYATCAEMEQMVRSAIKANPPDVIYVERWRPLQHVSRESGVPIICDPTDSMILYNKRLAASGRWWERIVGAEEYSRFLHYEPALARRADLTIFCSAVDRDCVLALDPGINCEIVPNGVDCEHFFRKQESEAEPGYIIFTGNFGYKPNVLAVNYFVKNVFPAIRRGATAAVKCLVVGNGATRAFRVTGHARDLEFVDFVPDLRPFLAKATVAVAPLVVGTGVSNKVLEAFAVGTPVVATRLACGDLPVRDGEHLYLADDPQLFAARVLELLGNASLRRQMAEKSRAFVESQYDWGIVTRKLEDLMVGLAEVRSGAQGAATSRFA
jgi:glycosyltransferase involved in cell wall biosynthesis